MNTSFPLSQAAEGAAVRVVALRGGQRFDRRMTEIGLNPGCELRVRQRQGGGFVVMRGEARFALGGGMAHMVIVERLEVAGQIDARATRPLQPPPFVIGREPA